MTLITRRNALIAGLGGSGFALSGCAKVTFGDTLNDSAGFQHVLAQAESWTLASQRFLLSGGAMAREYAVSDISPRFKANGTLYPTGQDYEDTVNEDFVNWRLTVDGMVKRPVSLSVAEVRKLPSRTQITRHDCVEGWSAIAQWTGVPVGLLLKTAGVLPQAKYVVFHCADNLEGEPEKAARRRQASIMKASPWWTRFTPRPSSPSPRTESPWTWPMAHRFGSGSSASSATSKRNTSSVSSSRTGYRASMAARAAIGKTAAMSGMRGYDGGQALSRDKRSAAAMVDR